MKPRAVGDPLSENERAQVVTALEVKGVSASQLRSEAEVKSVEQMRHRDKDRGLPWPT